MIWIDCRSRLQLRGWGFGTKLLEFSKDITFQTDFSIATSYAGLFATTLGDNVSRARREGLIDAIAYYLLGNPLYGLPGGDQLVQLLSSSMIVSFLVSSCRINILVAETSSIQCILTDFLLVLSNVGSLSLSCSGAVLHPYKFSVAFSRWDHVLSLKPPWSFLLCSCWSQRLTHLSYLDGLSVGDSFCMEVSASCADFSNRLNVLGLWLLLWVVEGSEWLALVARDDNEVEWLKPHI